MKITKPSFSIKTIIFFFGYILTFSVLLVCFAKISFLNKNIGLLLTEQKSLQDQLKASSNNLNDLKNQDQYKINTDLKEEITNIQTTYKKSLSLYEKIIDLREMGSKNNKIDPFYANILDLLSKRNYASASASIDLLNKQLDEEKNKLTVVKIPENIPSGNAPPNSGFKRQKVSSSIGENIVDIISADLNSTKIIVDTASDATCAKDCPVLPLATYVSRNGAFAGINGSYFCPATYPQCAEKKNSFDTLLMNKDKVYFNSDNNVYSTVPAVIFSGNNARFVSQSLEWGRDTGVDAVIANQPLLLLNGEIKFSSGGDDKQNNKGNRSFIGANGNTVYIGVVHGVTVAESAIVLKELGINNALNLDDGGSTALWSGGYKIGPGRDLPNAILFIKK